MARAIDANELEMFPYAEVAGTEEQIADWIEQVGLSGDDTASRARNLCWKVIEGFINVVKTQPALTPPNEWISVEDRLPDSQADVLVVAFWHENWQTMIGWHSDTSKKWRVITPHGEMEPGGVTHWMPLPEPPEKEE